MKEHRDYAGIEYRGTLPQDVTVVPGGLKVVPGKSARINKWKLPPHVAFANYSFKTPQDMKEFVQECGFSSKWIQEEFDLDETILALAKIQEQQEKLRRLWGKTGDTYSLSLVDIHFVNGRARITLSDIQKYIDALFLVDASAGRLAVCARPDCPRFKYFVKERRDQRFCSPSCKNAFHVNLWLADAENRKAWNAHRRRQAKSQSRKK